MSNDVGVEDEIETSTYLSSGTALGPPEVHRWMRSLLLVPVQLDSGKFPFERAEFYSRVLEVLW